MNQSTGLRIVRQWAGPGTAASDYFYVTEDGRAWRSDEPELTQGTTSPTRGTVYQGRIYPGRRNGA